MTGYKICQECRAFNFPDARSCHDCGASLEAVARVGVSDPSPEYDARQDRAARSLVGATLFMGEPL